jgi:hypothetical protein
VGGIFRSNLKTAVTESLNPTNGSWRLFRSDLRTKRASAFKSKFSFMGVRSPTMRYPGVKSVTFHMLDLGDFPSGMMDPLATAGGSDKFPTGVTNLQKTASAAMRRGADGEVFGVAG